MDFEHWEGITHDEVRASDPDAYRAWTTSGLEFRYPGGDLRQAFWDRVQRAAEERSSLTRSPEPPISES